MSAARRKNWHWLTMIALGVLVGSRVGLGQTVRRLPPAATQAAATVAQLPSNSTGEPAPHAVLNQVAWQRPFSR
jgi:hypothetical protein